jgi:hypothetical protein
VQVIVTSRWLALAAAGAAGCGAPGWRPLFDGKDLDGWYSWQDGIGRNADTVGMFKVVDGELHILDTDLAPGQFEFAYLATTEEHESFRARFEYRWGTRRYVNFGPDSGFFIHAVGPDMIWPRSIECQVMLGDTGSMYLFDYATLDTTIDPMASAPTYLAGGQPYTAPRNPEPNYARVAHDMIRDDPTEWNTVEVIAAGADVEFIVNGHTTFRGRSLRQPDPAAPQDPSRDVPLRRGRIVLQQEGSEVWYRNIEIQDL